MNQTRLFEGLAIGLVLAVMMAALYIAFVGPSEASSLPPTCQVTSDAGELREVACDRATTVVVKLNPPLPAN